MAAAKDRAKAAAVDLHALRARVISVGGPFNARTLIEMPTEVAAEMFPDGALAAAGPSRVLDAVERDLAKLRERDPALADSGLAAGAVAMAIEVEHPFNSATSKSMCQGKLFDALAELRRLAPPEKKEGELHDIKSGRALRLASGGSGT